MTGKQKILTIILCIGCVIAGGLIVVFVLPWFGKVIASWGSGEVMAKLNVLIG